MKKEKVNLIFFLLFLILLNVGFAEAASDPGEVLVVYEARHILPQLVDVVDAFQNILGHFELKICSKNIKLYKKGEIFKYKTVFYLGSCKNQSLNKLFIDDLMKYEEIFCWLGENIQFLNSEFINKKFGFIYEREGRDFCEIIFKDKILKLESICKKIPIVKVVDPKRCKVFAELNNYSYKAPYILNCGDFWYVPDMPFLEGKRTLVFSEVLHNILKIPHKRKAKILLLFEGIHPASSPIQLEKLSDDLNSYKVPFAISLIPFYVKKKGERGVSLYDKGEFLHSLKFAISKGASIVLNGYTHQYKGESGKEGEFWDVVANKVGYGIDPNFIEEKVLKGLHDCFDCKIYPIAWRTPLNAAHSNVYKVLTKYFSTFIEKIQISDLDCTKKQTFYFITKDVYGRKIIPENLGVIKSYPSPSLLINPIIRKAEELLLLRDPVGCIRIEPLKQYEVLFPLIQRLKALGYEFIDLKNEKNWVKTSKFCITTGGIDLTVNLKNEFLYSYLVNPAGFKLKETCSPRRLTGKEEITGIEPQGNLFIVEKLKRKPTWFTIFFSNLRLKLPKYSWLVDTIFLCALLLIWFLLLWNLIWTICGSNYAREVKEKYERELLRGLSNDDYPTISIIVPAHNEERVIAKTLYSLLNVDYPKDKVEILVVNDASIDRTGEIIEAIAKEDKRVIPIHTKPPEGGRGKARALNLALKKAKNELIGVYDADTTPEKFAFRYLAAALIKNPKAMAAVGKIRTINRHVNYLTRFINIEFIAHQWTMQGGRWKMHKASILPGTNFLIRRKELLHELGGWDENSLTEDTELSVRVYRKGYYIMFIPSAVSWEQEPEKLKVWIRQRTRWLQGNRGTVNKFIKDALKFKEGFLTFDMLFMFCIYYLFPVVVILSDIVFVVGIIKLTTASFYSVLLFIWVSAYLLFVTQIIIPLFLEEDEGTLSNFLRVLVLYFTYCQAWIWVSIRSTIETIKKGGKFVWVKTERF